jgi:hypothetical protein
MGARTSGDQSRLCARGRQDYYSSSAMPAVASISAAEGRALTGGPDDKEQCHERTNRKQDTSVGDGRVAGHLPGLDDRSDLNGCI